MEIEKLISELEYNGNYAVEHDGKDDITAEDGRLMLKAVETIKLLWEIARDTSNEEYRRKIDEMGGNNAT